LSLNDFYKVTYEEDTDLIGLWREMEKLVVSGRAKSIGVSNFNSTQLTKVDKIAKIPIATNQVSRCMNIWEKSTFDIRWNAMLISNRKS